MMGMPGKELKGTRGPTARPMAIWSRGGLDKLRRAGVAPVAFGLLMALWVILWIPSAPAP
jgi:hypothetical protein